MRTIIRTFHALFTIGQTTADAIEAVKCEGTVVIVRVGKLGANVNTYSMIVKEVQFLGSAGGLVEDLQGVYDCFATGKMNAQLIKTPFEGIDKGLEKLKNHEVKGRLVAVFESIIAKKEPSKKLMLLDGSFCYFTPLEPKPCAPRSVVVNSSTSSNSTCGTNCTTSCAIRICFSTVNGTRP